MNRGTITGGVVKAAVSAYVPATGARKVVLTIATRDSQGQDGFWRCEAEEPAVMDYLEREAICGRGIEVDFELVAKPFVQHGVQKGEVRFLRVFRACIAERRHKSAEAEATVETDA